MKTYPKSKVHTVRLNINQQKNLEKQLEKRKETKITTPSRYFKRGLGK